MMIERALTAFALAGTLLVSLPAAADPGIEDGAKDLGLPPIETLTMESDFTVFMGPEVPGDIRTLALRKLWHIDPNRAAPDGLGDYDGDYRSLTRVVSE